MQIENILIPGMAQSQETSGVSLTARSKGDGDGFSALLAALMGKMDNSQGEEVVEALEKLQAEGENEEELDMDLAFPLAAPYNLVNFQNQKLEPSLEGMQAEIPLEASQEVISVTPITEELNTLHNQVEVGNQASLEEEGQVQSLIEPSQKENPKLSLEKELEKIPSKDITDRSNKEVDLELGKPVDKNQPVDRNLPVEGKKEEKSEEFKNQLSNFQPEIKEVPNTEAKLEAKAVEPVVVRENIQRLNDSIIKLIETTTVDNKSVMKVKLFPEELGTLDLTLEMQEGKLLAKITVDSESVKQLFSDKLGDLSQNLLKQNINIQDFKIEVKPEASLDFNLNSHGNFNQEERQASRRNPIFINQEIITEEVKAEIKNTSGELSILA